MPRTFMTPQDFKAIRKAKGWSQETMASYLGVNTRTIYNYETHSLKDPTRGLTRIPRGVQLALDKFVYLIRPVQPTILQ